MWFIPLYKAPVRLVTVLQLTQKSPSNEAENTFEKSNKSLATASPCPSRPKYYITSQEDLYPVTDCMQFLLPGLGPFLWYIWQLCSTCLCVLGSLLFLPLYLSLINDLSK